MNVMMIPHCPIRLKKKKAEHTGQRNQFFYKRMIIDEKYWKIGELLEKCLAKDWNRKIS